MNIPAYSPRTCDLPVAFSELVARLDLRSKYVSNTALSSSPHSVHIILPVFSGGPKSVCLPYFDCPFRGNGDVTTADMRSMLMHGGSLGHDPCTVVQRPALAGVAPSNVSRRRLSPSHPNSSRSVEHQTASCCRCVANTDPKQKLHQRPFPFLIRLPAISGGL